MDKSAIKNFSIEARKILMKSAETEAGFYGVDRNGCKNPIQKGNDFEVYETLAGTENRIFGADIKKRANLAEAVERLGFEQVIEETAYTWFNRIIAIRFMEVNGYLPTRVRVLSSETGSSTPDIVTLSLEVDLNMTPEELKKVQKAKDENRYDDAFRMLFIKQCNELNAILPGLFEKTDDYMELLLKLSYTGDGVVRMLVDTVAEDNFNVEKEGQVEIIGWMYQYYNTELKDDTFAKLKKNVKITKERIPAATQLFTPDWIVRYMVENSVGRVWIEHLRAIDLSIDEKAKAEEFGWKYYLPEAEQEEDVNLQLVEIRKSYLNLEPKDITCIDPCMGSGHILVYMFDVLMDIYRSEGFSDRDAAFSILENNIRGLDIDRRAYQLSYFALMMKARGYNRLFFRGVQNEGGERKVAEPAVFAILESNDINREHLKYFGIGLNEIEKNKAMDHMNKLLVSLEDAKEYGSILDMGNYDWELLRKFINTESTSGQISFDMFGIDDTKRKLTQLISQGNVMAKKYWVVSTNPPYMGISNGNGKLNKYIKEKYPNSKADLFSVMIEKWMKSLVTNGIQSMITMQNWMFLSSYKKLRDIMLIKNMLSLLQFGIKAFEEIGNDVVQTASFTLRNTSLETYRTQYFRLLDRDRDKKISDFISRKNLYYAKNKQFAVIPGKPIAYWISDNTKQAFEKPLISSRARTLRGYATSSSEKYSRKWWEVDISNIGIGCVNNEDAYATKKRWFPYNKGGFYRKWYGNNEEIVDYYLNGEKYRDISGFCYSNQEYYFMESISWTKVCTGRISVRYNSGGYIFGDAGPALITDDSNQLYLIQAMLNSKFAELLLSVINPTLNYTNEAVGNIPVYCKKEYEDEIVDLTKKCIDLMKTDWDSYELSWDFKKHPLIGKGSLEAIFKEWTSKCNHNYSQIKKYEERINFLLVESFGLTEELDVTLDDRDICTRRADLVNDIKSLISFIVGCMFGRYNANELGLICTSNNDTSAVEYGADKDNIIPINSHSNMGNDIVSEFINMISVIYGDEYLESNLLFITKALGLSGKNNEEAIRNYFISQFYQDHCGVYTTFGSGKRPIYWLFDSGKDNGFKCLIYIHRYTKDTLNLIRSEYLHRNEDIVGNALKNAEYIIQNSSSAIDKAQATKDRNKYIRQLNEMRIYYQALSHLAIQKIEINLDEGIKNNYQLFQDIEVIVDGGKKQKVDLLAKI